MDKEKDIKWLPWVKRGLIALVTIILLAGAGFGLMLFNMIARHG